ncbi:MAG: quinol:cytochrome C oxidoreductase [Bacteroidota bacterium]
MIEEKYEFTSGTKKALLITIVIGIVLTIGGLLITMSGGGHGDDHGHADAGQVKIETVNQSDVEMKTVAAGGGEDGHHHGAPVWQKRLFSNLWINSIFFVGLALIGIFFFAIQYASQAGWSAGVLRVPLAFGNWLPFAALSIAVVFGASYSSHSLFHWLDSSLYDPESANYDKIIAGKSWYLNQGFYIGRFLVFFGVWYWLFKKLAVFAYKEDEIGGVDLWKSMRKWSAIFLVFFAVSSSMAAWDWVMSIDTHWFSTMFGWYVFASWWVSGLALITFIVVLLKDKGYLKVVNANHVHDLGKFVFAFSIFWTYIWFSQFLLIYYAGIPEETIYFVERWKNDHYAPVFFINLILNFFLPFLLLMTRDSKRHGRILKVVCPIIIFGHWLDFYLMITPGTLQENGGFGLLEIGLLAIYAGSFLYVVLSNLAKKPLVAKNHPMLQESLNHHI